MTGVYLELLLCYKQLKNSYSGLLVCCKQLINGLSLPLDWPAGMILVQSCKQLQVYQAPYVDRMYRCCSW